MHYHFTTAGRLSDSDKLGETISQSSNPMLMRIGAVGKDTLGTSLKIMVKTEDGGRHVIREITSLAELPDNSVRLLQPGSEIDVEVAGSPNLYVEFKEFRDEESQR